MFFGIVGLWVSEFVASWVSVLCAWVCGFVGLWVDVCLHGSVFLFVFVSRLILCSCVIVGDCVFVGQGFRASGFRLQSFRA